MARPFLWIFILMCPSPCCGQLIIAHRGASHDAPENTLAAFRLAWEQGADGVEADFHLTADGKVVCIHDKDTKRVAGVEHVVARTPYETLRKLDVGAWKGEQNRGAAPPLCDEVLAAVPSGKMIFVELKTGPEIVDPIADCLRRSSLEPDQVLIISFNQATLRECAEKIPHIRTHWLSGYKKLDGRLLPGPNEVVDSLHEAAADGFGFKGSPDHFNAAFVGALREAGFGVFHVWTLDDPRIARFYCDLGAFSITTNRPGWLRTQLASLGETLD